MARGGWAIHAALGPHAHAGRDAERRARPCGSVGVALCGPPARAPGRLVRQQARGVHDARRRVLQEFRRGLAGTPFETAMLRYNKSAPRCPCCTLYGVNGSSFYSTRGSCEFDELLLPTFVWQYHRDLLARASPALAMRAWQRPQIAQPLVRAMDATATTVFSSRHRFPQAFAIKVPHRHAPDIVAMFNSTFSSLAPDDVCLRTHVGSAVAPGWY